MNPQQKGEELLEKASEIMEMACRTDPTVTRLDATDMVLFIIDEIVKYPGTLMYDIVWYEFRETDINNWLDTEPLEVKRMNALEYWIEVKTYIENEKAKTN